MWKVGDLVYYRRKNCLSNSFVLRQHDECYGIVTEAWCDEDDTTALIVDFQDGPTVFREPEHKYLRVIYAS